MNDAIHPTAVNDTATAGTGTASGTPETPSKPIVVGLDGSDESFAALEWALREAHKTGEEVNAVFGWTSSWDVGGEPSDEETWAHAREQIETQLRGWIDRAVGRLPFDAPSIRLTSVRASGTSALLEIGRGASQIVVGRRSLGRVARWFLGSTSASIAQEAQVPVTIVRLEDMGGDVEDQIGAALRPDAHSLKRLEAESILGDRALPVVAGIDGSDGSLGALNYAAQAAARDGAPLHVLFCWQMRDLMQMPGYGTATPSLEAASAYAERLLAGTVAKADIPDGVEVFQHAFHIPAAKGLLNASRYASRLVVGSRGLSGFDAHFIGSVSRRIVDLAECTVTVVH